MSRKKNKIIVSEEFQISAHLALRNFEKENKKELEFPSSFTSTQRAYIHRYCVRHGLKSKSKGKAASRFITVYKKEESTMVQSDLTFTLGRGSQYSVLTLCQKFPLTARERQMLMPLTERDKLLVHNNMGLATARLNIGVPQVPHCRLDLETLHFRQTLPIWNHREEILQAIIRHQVVLLTGETGCGKTTQVPQYILDHCASMVQPCRIICTQPRRIAAISVSERVALERYEKVGQTVGYQIRLESRTSARTLLTFCTNGVLLRTLMGGDSFASTLTHVIVDELHERDRLTDFLIIVLRDLLLKYRGLKLILMSAVLDVNLFVKYFGGCPVVEIPGRLFDVQTYFLEDILKSTGYTTKTMNQYQDNLGKQSFQKKALESWCTTLEADPSPDAKYKALQESNQKKYYQGATEKIDPDQAALKRMNKLIFDAWQTGSEEHFTIILQLLLADNVPVDYQHTESSVTPLMVAAARGNIEVVEQLLSLGANIHRRSSNGWNAMDFAKHYGHKEVEDVFNSHNTNNKFLNEEDITETEEEYKIPKEVQLLLDAYQHTTDEERVDLNLILCVIKHIFMTQADGSILIFLPGYDDITALREQLLNCDRDFLDTNSFIVFTLHSQMQTADQKAVFKPVPHDTRKIILSTNIGETSVTVNDVVYVIDSGKVKEKTYDALMGTTQLRAGWVSQSSAVQRRGRAGRCRPGVCYHLFSHKRFQSLQKFQVPEILRVPIHELCLQAKLLATVNVPIADFLARAPDPPPFMVTRNAINLLKTIDALDTWEDLTELGLYMLDLPIEPRLAKMILYSVVLKCLDPVLTIACALAYRDPFLLPLEQAQKLAAKVARKKLAGNTYSDHVALLRALQLWQTAKANNYEKSFCSKNFLSAATMEMIFGMRAQLISQLRASGFIKSRGGNGDLRDLNTNSEVWPVVKAALCAGSYPNVITIDRERQQLLTQKECKVRFHPSSVLNQLPSSGKKSVAALHKENFIGLPCDFLIYEEMSRAGHISYAHCCTLVTPITIALFCGPARLPHDSLHEPDQFLGLGQNPDNSESDDEASDNHNATLKLDDWITFKADPEIARLAFQVRQKWHALFLRRMHMPTKPWSQADEAVVHSLVKILINEEHALGLQQPGGIGQRTHYPSSENYFPNMRSQPNPYQRVPTNPSYPPSSTEIRANTLTVPVPEPKPYFNAAVGSGSSTCSAMRRMYIDKQRAQYQAPQEPLEMSSMHPFGTANLDTSPTMSPPEHAPGFTQIRSPVMEQRLPAYRSVVKIRYFIVKVQNPKLLDLSVVTSVWPFPPDVERNLLEIAKEETTVILIFSLQSNGNFQGYARFTTTIADQRISESFNPMGACYLGNCYYVEWLKRGNIPFQNMRIFQNGWNEKKNQICRDGQELDPSIGESLCRMWERPAVQKVPVPQRHGVSMAEAFNVPQMRSQAFDTRIIRQSQNPFGL